MKINKRDIIAGVVIVVALLVFLVYGIVTRSKNLVEPVNDQGSEVVEKVSFPESEIISSYDEKLFFVERAGEKLIVDANNNVIEAASSFENGEYVKFLYDGYYIILETDEWDEVPFEVRRNGKLIREFGAYSDLEEMAIFRDLDDSDSMYISLSCNSMYADMPFRVLDEEKGIYITRIVVTF